MITYDAYRIEEMTINLCFTRILESSHQSSYIRTQVSIDTWLESGLVVEVS